jgi:hypothetical protein
MLQQKMLESSAGASVDPVLPTSNGVRDIEYEDLAQDGKVREIVMDNPQSDSMVEANALLIYDLIYITCTFFLSWIKDV